MIHPLSEQQQAVMAWAADGEGHLNLVARAGTGKTTTLIELCSRIPGTAFLGAYNKKIAEEIKLKLQDRGIPSIKTSSTMHAAGFGAWKRVSPSCEVEESKVYNICKTLRIAPTQIGTICKAVSLAKQHLFAANVAPASWEYLWDQFELEVDLPFSEAVVEDCRKILAESIRQDDSCIDFDDMLYAPLMHDARIPSYDWVLIDEAQDTNASRRELAIRMLNGSGRLIAVGDECQAIYGFTGADADAMKLIKDRLGSQDLPLNVTYRCPQSVVRLAQTWVPDIQAAPGSPEGKVVTIKESGFSMALPKDSDVIICRNTKPLLELAYMAIRQGRGVRVEGREIGRGLLKLAQRFNEDRLREIQPRLETYRLEEINRLREKGKFNQITSVEDKCECLSLMISQSLESGGGLMAHLEKRIETLFGDTYGKQTLLTLSTIHKAKGREWPTVWLWGRNRYQPSYYAKLSADRGINWPLGQERNLAYVAVTRAKENLVEIEVELPFKKF